MVDEIVDIVDEEDNVIDTMPRKEAAKNKLRMRASKVLVFDEEENMVIHQRSLDKKRKHPGKWDIGVTEVLKKGEAYFDGALRGLKEEYGLDCNDAKFLFKYIFPKENSNKNYEIFKVYINNEKINFDKEEIEQIKAVSKEEMIKMIDTEDFTPSSLPIYEEYLKNHN